MLRETRAVVIFLFFLMITPRVVLADEKRVVTYEKDVKKIISERCHACHGSDSPLLDEFVKDKERFKQKLKGPRMDTYQNLMVFVTGKDAGALMRRLDDGKNTRDGKPGNMFIHLGKTDSEKTMNLDVIKKWIGGWTLKRKAEMTEDDLKAIKARER